MKNWTALWMGFVLGASGTAAFAASPKVVDVHNVQEAIARKHAHWRAKDTWLNHLSKNELHRMMGVQRPPQARLDFEGLHTESQDIPSSLDWRNKGGLDWLGPVMNQGNCGSCVAFATVATLEAQVSISSGLPWIHPTFSPQELFACGGGGCDSGWMPDEAADFLQNSGITDEACLPYTSGSTGLDVSCNQRCADADSRSFKIASYTTPTSWGGSIDQVKAALQHGPLVTTLNVYTDFLTYGGGVYKHVTGDVAGGHAVSIVGYDNAKRAWLIRNSWGPEWGDHGFGWVSWDDDSGVGSETWGFDVASPHGYLSVTSPSDKEYVSGKYQFEAKTKDLTSSNVQFVLTGADGTKSPMVCRSEGSDACSAQIDTTQLKEGRYEIYADNGSVRSQVREFYVINSAPKMSLSFVPAEGVDLSKPLNGRPEFVITANYSPVPIQHLEFRVLDKSGKVVSFKTDDYVLPQMKMGWRTATVADGQYTIIVHGETTYQGRTYSVDSNSYNITVKN